MEGIHNERYIQWKSPVHNEAIVLSIASPHIQTLHVSRPSPHFHHIFPRLWRQIWTFFGVRGLVSGSTGVQNHSPTWSTIVGKSMNSVRGTAGSAFQGQTLWLVWQALLNFYDEMQFFSFFTSVGGAGFYKKHSDQSRLQRPHLGSPYKRRLWMGK